MSINNIFPIGITASWQRPDQFTIPDACLKNWLLDTSSLTERLQSQCRQLDLTLIGQSPMLPSSEEQQRLKQVNEDWQIREVLLSAEHCPWVFARSVLPDALCQTDLAELGKQPLGKILFNDKRFVRQPFEIACINAPDPIFEHFHLDAKRKLWARRSIFTYLNWHMMVAEVFLPESPAFKMLQREQAC